MTATTLAEKIWNEHVVVKGEDGQPDLLYIDLHLVHEVTSPQAFEGLRMAGRKDRPIILICRSGKRSVDAGVELEKHGFTHVSNVLEGFEGDRDASGHRNTVGGWRAAGLPWVQS